MEIPDSLTPVYSQFYFNNKSEAIIGLSATINKNIQYVDKNNKMFTKGDLLDKIAPICFKYTVNQGQLEGTSRKLNIYIINHELDPINKTVKAGSTKTSFFQTELNAYKYWDTQFKKSLFLNEDEPHRDLKILIASNKRRDLLYKLPSKIDIIKKLLDNIKGKSIVFGNSIDSLLQITRNTVSSRNTQEQNNVIREYFDNNKIKVIGSFKKLQQGANLGLLDNVILHSYYGVEGKFIQMFGRARINEDKIGNVFILATKDTQELVWLNKAIENFTEYNIIYCDNLEDCTKKYKENE